GKINLVIRTVFGFIAPRGTTPQTKKIKKRGNTMLAIQGGKVITISGGVLEPGTVLVENGTIKAVGPAGEVAIPSGAELIDATGKWVTPGFIDAHTHISTFNEPQTMPGTYDGNEMSDPVTAHVRGIDALNPRDMAIGVVRAAGITTCYTGPGSANIVGGTGICFKTKEGKTVFDIAIPGTECMKFALGENPRRVYGSDKKMPMTRMGVGALFRETLYRAKHYSDKLREGEADSSKAPTPDFRLEALVPVIRREMKARIHCHRSDDIVTAVRVAEEFGLDYTIEHCTEGYLIADFLKEHNVKFVLGPLTVGPSKMELWNCTLKSPAIMEQSGITDFCIMEDTSSQTKYLPTHIGLCMARGLSEEMAFRSVTVNPAKLLGIWDRVGSLESGKDADIAIWSGNPFSNFTLCETTIIDGDVYHNEN
ncbi:amidohydrolase, partial [Ruminococcaceae bacterium OttesenSCG-928-L11]|nr:amidohydrolase [Ruminococcaceae bacterium OttesenSCG-928-L11]